MWPNGIVRYSFVIKFHWPKRIPSNSRKSCACVNVDVTCTEAELWIYQTFRHSDRHSRRFVTLTDTAVVLQVYLASYQAQDDEISRVERDATVLKSTRCRTDLTTMKFFKIMVKMSPTFHGTRRLIFVLLKLAFRPYIEPVEPISHHLLFFKANLFNITLSRESKLISFFACFVFTIFLFHIYGLYKGSGIEPRVFVGDTVT